MRTTTWRWTRAPVGSPGPWGEPFPGGNCFGGPCCCVVAFLNPLLLATISVRVIRAATRPRVRAHHAEGGHDAARLPDGRVARLLCCGVRFYQAELSALTPHCPHTPSCSQYAADALHRHGAARGSWLAVRRLVRCRPGTGGGPDPVP